MKVSIWTITFHIGLKTHSSVQPIYSPKLIYAISQWKDMYIEQQQVIKSYLGHNNLTWGLNIKY